MNKTILSTAVVSLLCASGFFASAQSEAEATNSLTVTQAAFSDDYNSRLAADANGDVAFAYSFTVTNNSNSTFNPGDDNYSITLFEATDGLEFQTFDIPDILVPGESKTYTTSGSFPISMFYDVKNLSSTGAYWVGFRLRENIGSTVCFLKWLDVYDNKPIYDITNTSNSAISALSFGFVSTTPKSQAFKFRNRGMTEITVSSITLPAGYSIDAETPFTLSPVSNSDNTQKTITVTLGNEFPGICVGNMVFNLEGIDTPTTLALEGAAAGGDYFFTDFEGDADPTGWIIDSGLSRYEASGILEDGNTKVLNNSSASYTYRAITPCLTAAAGDQLVFLAGACSNSSRDSAVDVYWSSDRSEWTLLKQIRNSSYAGEGQDAFSSNVPGYSYQGTELKIFTVDMPEGNGYLAFDINYARIDNVFGCHLADVSHDLYLTGSSIPNSGTVNNLYTASLSAKNLLATDEDAGSYTFTLYFNDEAVATTTNTEEIPGGETTSVAVSFTPHSAGTFQVYAKLEFADGTSLKTPTSSVIINEESVVGQIIVGTGVATDSNYSGKTTPLRFYDKKSMSHMIFTEDYLAQYGILPGTTLTGLSFMGYMLDNKTLSGSLYAWMQPTTLSELSTSDGFTPDDSTQVFADDNYTIAAAGSKEEPAEVIPMSFRSPYVYNGGNLLITVNGNWNAYNGSNGFVLDTALSNRGIIKSNDSSLDGISYNQATGLAQTIFQYAMTPNSFSGTVVDETSQQPIANVDIILTSGDVIYKGTTDENGQFSINVIQSDKEYTVTVDEPNHPVYTSTVSFADGNATATIALKAFGTSRSYRLTVKVNNPTGQDFENASYTLRSNLYDINYSATETTLSADGSSAINIFGGSHTITVAYTGMRTATKTFSVNKDTTVTIDLEEDINQPYSLHADVDHNVYTGQNNIQLSWNQDETVFFDDFESYSPFSINPTPWTGIDLDGRATAEIDGSYPNRGTAQYITIANPSAVDPAWDLQYYYTLSPYSGNQYAAFVQPSSGDNNDWFISPTITVGKNNILTFHMRVADATAGKLKVGITTAEQPSATDFTTISEGNYLSPTYNGWTEVTIPLSDYEGQDVKLGFNCTSANGALMTMIDDVFVGRINSVATKARRVARSAANPNEKFVIVLDGVKVAETTDYAYTIENVADGTHTVGVKAVLITGESEAAEHTVVINSALYAKLTATVATNNGISVDGQALSISDGINTYAAEIAEGSAEIASLPKAAYTVTAKFNGFDPSETSVTLDGDQSIAVQLTETITAPYNITADVTEADDGSFSATLNWNRDLGFTDSFEDYDDFATGSFGGWTTLNFNGEHQVSYPISLGGSIISYPGASTSDSPVSVPPLVFNPFATTPSVESDGAFLAPDGNKYIAFMSPQQATSDKWLISPKVKVYDNYVFRMTAKSYPIYPESLEILISTTGTNTADFTEIDTIVVPYTEWSLIECSLADYAGQEVYIAVRDVTYDGFVAQVDNIQIVPDSDSATGNVGFVQSYDITLDAQHHGNTTETTYVVNGLDAEAHTVGITANYASGSSTETLYVIEKQPDGIGNIASAISSVTTKPGVIIVTAAADTNLMIADMSGRVIANTTASKGKSTWNVAPGVYALRLGSATMKVVVK